MVKDLSTLAQSAAAVPGHKTLLSKYFLGLNNAWEHPCAHVYPWGDLAFNFFLSTCAFITCASCLFYLH